MKSVQVIKEFCQLAGSMRPDDECVIHVAKPAERLIGRRLQSHFFKVFHEKTDGVAMGSPLSPVITNYFMEYLAHSSLMMEAVRTSETSVDNYFTRQYIPENNSGHHTRRRENLKSHKF
jgi:hypothetical protein